MTPQQEGKILSALLRQLDRPSSRFMASVWPPATIFVVVTLFVMLLFQFAKGGHYDLLLLASLSALLGFLVPSVLFRVAVARSWPVVRNHVNRESVQSRLREIEP